MPLPGQKIGPYQISGQIGAGGMGEVFRAHDARLGRDVAIKLLPASFSADPDRLQRFTQEARAAAALNHPNILAIFDIGEHDHAPYIVSELLEGETLRARMKNGPLPARKAVDYALQMARGLAAAHAKGIVHRDLKPENIFVTPDGRIKILDFGLAKLTRPDEHKSSSDAPTMQVVTDVGMVMGTVGYMSPEQVRGAPADHRSDIFALGSILYEMISGRRAFHGDTSADTMSAILKEEPPEFSEEARNVPPALERIVRHCLEKNPGQRFQSASDVAFNLEALTEISSASGSKSGAQRLAAAPSWRRWLLPGLAGLVLAVVLLGVYFAGKHSVAGFNPSFHRLTFRRGTILAARFSPDGQTIVYGGALEGRPTELFTTRFDSTDSRPLGLEKTQLLGISSNGELAVSLDVSQPSPFVQKGTLGRVPLAGGAPRQVAENICWADWTPDGSEVAVARIVGGLNKLEFPLGHTIYDPRGWVSHLRFSPQGDQIAFADHVQTGDDGRIVVVDRNGVRKVSSSFYITIEGLAWSADGREVWFTASKEGAARAIFAINLAGKERMVLRVPGALTLQDITRTGRVLLTLDNAQFGILGFRAGDAHERNLSWFDWSLVSDVSKDGKDLLFFESGEGVGSNYSIFMRGMDGSPAMRLGSGGFPALSPDGKWVAALNGDSPSQVELLPTGTGQPQQLTHDSLEHVRVGWVPDGKAIVFSASEGNHAARSYWMDLAARKSRPLTPEGTTGTLVSPDGKYLLAIDQENRRWLYPLEGGDPLPSPYAIGDGDLVLGWDLGGKALLVGKRGTAFEVSRIFPNSTRREVVRTFAPSDPAGVVTVGGVRFSADQKSYAYSYFRITSDLYVVDGLK
ncbi:MAG: protein kinase [Acidobacteria bacterium]|nr:protein kinase [Acidobacteriota bacterium]